MNEPYAMNSAVYDSLVKLCIDKPQSLDESFIRGHGRLGHLGDSEWRTEADNRVHRERDHDGAVFSSSGVDIRREDRKRREEDTVAKW